MSLTELLAFIPGATRELIVRFNDVELTVEMNVNLVPVYASATQWVGGVGTRLDSIGDAPSVEIAFAEYLKACGVADVAGVVRESPFEWIQHNRSLCGPGEYPSLHVKGTVCSVCGT